VTLIVDAAPLVALMDRDDPMRPTVRQVLRSEPGRLIVPAPVTAEVDYFVSQRLGRVARRAFYTDLANGNFGVACSDLSGYRVRLMSNMLISMSA
jgi:predicted nucleic acid-binding protein